MMMMKMMIVCWPGIFCVYFEIQISSFVYGFRFGGITCIALCATFGSVYGKFAFVLSCGRFEAITENDVETILGDKRGCKMISPRWEEFWELFDSQNGVTIGGVWHLSELRPCFIFLDNSLLDQFLFTARPGKGERQMRIKHDAWYGPPMIMVSTWKQFTEKCLDEGKVMAEMDELISDEFEMW